MKNTKNNEKNQSEFFSQESLMLACLVLPLDAVLMLSEAGVSQCMFLYPSNLPFPVQSSKLSAVYGFFPLGLAVHWMGQAT